MSEKLGDVVNAPGRVLHTYPVTLPDADDGVTHVNYEEKALEAAHYGTLVSNNEFHGLTTRIHLRREGSMEPYDSPSKDSELKASLEQDVRLKAYSLWEQSGGQTDQAEENWSAPCSSIFAKELVACGRPPGWTSRGILAEDGPDEAA